jgi:type IV pilus assembly protein PilV
MRITSATAPRPARGFTLIEVLVSIVIIGVGLLGIAKMQALAFSSTGVASKRSLAALEASSLAASMHGDRAYWASGVAAPAPGFTIAGTVISDPNLSLTVPVCTSATLVPANCNPTQLAAFDVNRWAQAVSLLLPNPVTTIQCTNVVGSPVLCTVTVTWSENMVAMSNLGNNAAGMQAPTYVLYVEP